MWLQLLLTSACNICQRHWKQAAFVRSHDVILSDWKAWLRQSLQQYQGSWKSSFGNWGPLWLKKILNFDLRRPFQSPLDNWDGCSTKQNTLGFFCKQTCCGFTAFVKNAILSSCPPEVTVSVQQLNIPLLSVDHFFHTALWGLLCSIFLTLTDELLIMMSGSQRLRIGRVRS